MPRGIRPWGDRRFGNLSRRRIKPAGDEWVRGGDRFTGRGYVQLRDL